MSVATQLGLDDPSEGLLGQAHQWWGRRAREHVWLAVVDDLAALPGWLSAVPPATRDQVLGTLSALAYQGEDEAAAVLTWLLAPGACLLANRMREKSEEVDDLVAAQLWIEARTFGPARGRRVAVSILWKTRNAVLREIGVGPSTERAWGGRVSLDPAHPAWERLQRPAGDDGLDSVELGVLFEQARAARVVDGEDLELLLDLAYTTHAVAPTHRGQSRAGLMSPAAATRAAASRGVSARTVRRRAARSADALYRYAISEMSA